MIPSFYEVMKVTGNVPATATLLDVEAKGLYDCVVQVPPGGILVEIGCQLGRSSSLISTLAYSIGFDDIHIDPYTRQPDWMKGWMDMMYHLVPDEDHAFTLLCMRTQQAERILKRLAPFDMAYIDGDHEKDSVLIDLHLVGDRVRPTGLLAVHDYSMTDQCFHGVREAMEIYLASGFWNEVGTWGTLGVWRRRPECHS